MQPNAMQTPPPPKPKQPYKKKEDAEGYGGGIIVPLNPLGMRMYDEGERFDLRSPYSGESSSWGVGAGVGAAVARPAAGGWGAGGCRCAFGRGGGACGVQHRGRQLNAPNPQTKSQPDDGWVDPEETDAFASIKNIGKKLLNFSGRKEEVRGGRRCGIQLA